MLHILPWDIGLSESRRQHWVLIPSDIASGQTTMWLPLTQNRDVATGPGA